MGRSKVLLTLAAAFGLLVSASPAAAQFDVNARAGVAVPTFDIADAADPGFNFGGGVALWLSDRVTLRGNVDFGMHPSAVDGGADIDVSHFIAGLGLLLTDPANSFFISVNLGAGFLNFSPDVEGVDSETNFAINAGAEIGTWLSDNVAIFLSPQGDIAFTDEDALGTSNAWVWPFTAGLKVRFQ